jgi:glucose 1-dehydrogenase
MHASGRTSFDLSGRKALVTGSSRGIGAAIAVGLAEAGADVALHCVGRRDDAETVAGTITSLGRKAPVVQADLNTDDGPGRLFEDAVSALGRIDILVLNASVQYRRAWNDFVRDEVDAVFRINVRASYELMALALPPMQERGWGRLLTLGSVQQARPSPLFAPYAAGKLAQLGLVRTLAPQVARDGVTINNLSPGVFETERNAEALSDPEYRQVVLDMIPAGAFGVPEDCVGAALLLCSDAGRYITGADLFVDGGMVIGGR